MYPFSFLGVGRLGVRRRCQIRLYFIYQGILPEGIEQVAIDLLPAGMATKQVMWVIGLSLERTQQRQGDILF
jgi:hypothetical protein